MILQKKLERRRRRREESAQGAHRGPAGDAPDEDMSREKEQVGLIVCMSFVAFAHTCAFTCPHFPNTQ